MVVEDVLEHAVRTLRAAQIEDAKTDAFLLLEKASGINRSMYVLYKDKEITQEQFDSYKKLIERRAAHEPCQYITGICEFMGLPFMVNENVLIPRQDTEVMVEKALRLTPGNADVLDMCTGSGCIAISMQRHRPDIKPVAVDISEAALELAMENARKHRCRIGFKKSDLFGDLDRNAKFDVIISNPPYVSDQEYDGLMPEIKVHEPELALKAGPDGLDIYKRLIKDAGFFIKPEGVLLLEIGSGQAKAVTSMLKESGFENIEVIKDYAGLDRVVTARWKC